MNTKSVAVDESFINKPKAETIRGVNAITMLSPFDVPQSASCEFDEHSGTLTFKFIYLSDDKKYNVVSSGDGLVKLTIGKASDRVYKIEIGRACTQKNQSRISVLECTLNGLKKYLTLHPENKSGSFDAVESVLEKYEDKLIPNALAC